MCPCRFNRKTAWHEDVFILYDSLRYIYMIAQRWPELARDRWRCRNFGPPTHPHAALCGSVREEASHGRRAGMECVCVPVFPLHSPYILRVEVLRDDNDENDDTAA